MKANTERNNETPSCASVAPLLTALFDGEADAQTAQSARAHLLSCERCARAWLDWNQYRSILLNESVPAPPPTLLWRVLLACRLANFAQRKKMPRASRRAETALPTEVASQNASLFPEPELPANLSARILAQTTRREHAAPAMGSTRRETPRSRWRLATWPTLAMPALAAWIFLLGQNAQYVSVEAPPVNEAEVPTLVAPEMVAPEAVRPEAMAPVAPSRSGIEKAVAAQRPTRRVAITRPTTSETANPKTQVNPVAGESAVVAAKSVVQNARQVREQDAAEEREEEEHAREERASERRRQVVQAPATSTRPVENRGIETRVSTRRAPIVLARFDANFAKPRESRTVQLHAGAQRTIVPVRATVEPKRSEPVALAPATSSASERVILVNAPRIARAPRREIATRPRFRKASLSDEIKRSRSSVARPVLANLLPDDNTPLRLSQPVSSPIRTAPRFAALETPDAAEEHVEEMRSWVDGFRSSFNNDDNLDASDSDAS
jgi:hypothetical protein